MNWSDLKVGDAVVVLRLPVDAEARREFLLIARTHDTRKATWLDLSNGAISTSYLNVDGIISFFCVLRNGMIVHDPQRLLPSNQETS